MNKGLRTTFATALVVLGICTVQAAGPTFRFADHGKPQLVVPIGDHASVKIFSDVASAGILLHNTTADSITIRDTVSLDSLTLAPGMRLGMSCNSMRHLALSIDDALIYESVACGSEMRFSSNGGQQ